MRFIMIAAPANASFRENQSAIIFCSSGGATRQLSFLFAFAFFLRTAIAGAPDLLGKLMMPG